MHNFNNAMALKVTTFLGLGWTMEDSPDEERLKSLTNEMAEEIFNTSRNIYTTRRCSHFDGTCTGISIDWFYSDDGNVNNKYRAAALGIELRDFGQYGFELPPSQVKVKTNKQHSKDYKIFSYVFVL